MRRTALLKAAISLALIAAPRICPAVELYLERSIPCGRGEIAALAFDATGGSVLYGTADGAIALVDVATGAKTVIRAADGKAITAAVSPDGESAAAAVKGGAVLLFGLGGGSESVELKEARGRIAVLAFSGDGRYLAAGGNRKDIVIWEAPSGRFRSTLKGHDGGILAVAFDEAGRSVISVGRDKRMIVWDAATAKPLRRHDLEARTIAGSGFDVISARVSADRLFIAVGIEERMLEKGAQKMLFKHHLAFFDVSKGVLLKVLEDNVREIEHIGLYPGNCFAAFDNSTLQQHSIALRSIESGGLELSYPMRSACRLLEFSPDGRRLAGAAAPGRGSEGAELDLWTVGYEMPASGCFSGRVRLTSTLDPVLKKGARRVAAVLPFATDEGDEDLGRAAGSFMESRLAGNPGLKLVERARVDDIVKELALQKSALVDKSSAVRAGKLLGAALIVTGGIVRAGADLVVSARVIDAKTGEILGAREVHCGQCGADDIFDAIALLAPAIAEE